MSHTPNEIKSETVLNDSEILKILRNFLLSEKPPETTPVDTALVSLLIVFKAIDHDVYHSQQTLARMLGCDVKTIVRCQKRLASPKLDWLARPRRKGRSSSLCLKFENVPSSDPNGIFDQLAANQKTSSPTTKPQPSPSQPQDIFDQLATGGDSTTVPSSNPSGQTEPGLLNRLYETSGAKGMVELGKQAFQRPIDRYHEAVDAAQKGDWIGATEAANNLINGGITDKDNPLYKAAEAIIMHPIDEIKATYKENRKAGGGVNDLANSYRDLKGRISKDAATGNIAGVTGDLAGTLDSHEMGSIPVLGSAIQQEGGNLDTDLHDRNYRAIAGDILGPLLTFGLGKTISSLGDAADAINTVKPATAEIAGEDVPIASNNPQLAGEQSTLSRLASRVATKKGAEQFVKDQVQPAAVRATQSNFTRSALDAVDELRSIRGEAPVSATPPVLHSVDAYTDEGTHDHDVLVEEQHGVPVGTVTSVGSNTVQATISAGFGTEGQGRYLGNTNAAKVISGVYPTAYTLGNPTFPPSPTIWGIDGPVPPMGQFVGTSFTPSTLIMGCTTAFGGSCPNSASVNPSGELKSATGGYAPGILNVQVVSQAPGLPNAYGTDSTGFSPGDTVCVADNEYMEETTVTAVPDSSHVTINFTKPHFNGFTIAKGGMCGYGVEVTGSTTTIGGVTYRQVWPVVGTLDSTDLLVWDHNSQQNWSHSMLIGGNATCKTATVGNFSNVGAVITMQDAANTALFRNKTGVTITTANGTYNGTFDLTSGTGYYDGTPNVANLSYTATGTPSGAVPTTGTITFCNSGFNLYPIAEVLDVLNPSTHAVDGYFKVGVNNGSFAAGDTVAEFHWPAQQIEAGGESVFQELPMQPYNGFALDGIAAGDNFTGGWALWQLDNQTAASKYQGYGGSLSTSGIGLHFKGLFGDTIQFDNAPDQTLFEVLACKPSPIRCTNKALSRFNIYLNDAVGNQFIADNPALGSIDFGNFIRVGAGGGGSGPFGMAMYSPVFGTIAFSQDQVPGSSLTPDATIEAQNYQFWSAITPPTGFQHVSMYGDGSTSLGMQFLAADGSHTTYQGGTFSLGGLQFYHPGTTTAVKTAGISVDSTTADMYLDDATPGDAGANVHAKSLTLSAGCTGCGGAIYTNNGVALPTTVISANSCTAATGSPFTATGVASTNLATYGWASDPSGVAGYGSTKALDVEIVPSSGTVSVKVCNYTASSETPGAISINVRVNP